MLAIEQKNADEQQMDTLGVKYLYYKNLYEIKLLLCMYVRI